jgi:serine phosphatase RsbU (regulator of sigma subunit)
VYNYSLINPQVSYRLEGFDSEYTTVGRNSLAPVDYTNLRGGNYRFVLRLQEPVTRRYKTISVSIVKEKAFYEHIWFFVLAGLFAAAAVGVCVNAYIRKKEVQLEKKHRERAEQERIASELSMANRIQASMLPGNYPAFPDRTEFDVFATMDPAKEVGGDFYDFFLIDDDHLGLVIADVSGKGIPAALFMMISKSLVKNCAMLGRSPAEILETTNESICANNREEMFVTVWVGILEISTGKLTAANAGHEYPTIKRADSGFEIYKDKHGFVIGGMEGMIYKEYTIDLSPGDKLFLYTDGVPEATDRENQLFGTERMLAALNSAPEASPQDILRNVRRAVDLFVQNEEQFDDLTMLCIEYKGVEVPESAEADIC